MSFNIVDELAFFFFWPIMREVRIDMVSMGVFFQVSQLLLDLPLPHRLNLT